MSAATETRPDATTAVAQLIRFLETGEAADGLFAPDVFADLTMPTRRVRIASAADLIALVRRENNGPRRVSVSRVEPTGRGFTLEYDEPSSRAMVRADVAGATITELAIYCLSPAPAPTDH